jgi:hypothetical protein
VSTQDFSPEWIDPFEIDTTVAHAARRYNYWLGGKDNFEADRISGDAIAAAAPAVRIAVMENRRFLRRAVTYLVKEVGIRQFLDIGTGIPTAGSLPDHQPTHDLGDSPRQPLRIASYFDSWPGDLVSSITLCKNSAYGRCPGNRGCRGGAAVLSR